MWPYYYNPYAYYSSWYRPYNYGWGWGGYWWP
jgi:hypothetical protein